MKLAKTKKILLSLLLIISLLSFLAINIIENQVSANAQLDIQELSQSKDQIVMQFDFCRKVLKTVAEIIVDRTY